ncbi:CF298 protein, partial [Corvus moneduloides]|nr:CF298 protein [Corvus moneduloides]
AGTEVIKESEAQLWWAGKQLEETKLLSDYVGKNEKTTIIVKIQKVSIARRFLYKFLTLGYLFSVGENYP